MYVYVPQKILRNAILKSQRGKRKTPQNKTKNNLNGKRQKGNYYEERY